jgi:ABC-type multidrug transport system ATPase subunit
MSFIAHEPSSDVVIDLIDAVAVLGSFPALAGATLSVRRGEIVLLQGPNGAGKTTLLRLCAGLIPLERGQGYVLGVDLKNDRELVRHRVGVIGHNNGLYADLTVTENVRFWGRTALAGLVARRAELWLLDEPHAGLDAAGRDELDQVLKMAASAGATVMVASHELERAGQLATRQVEVVAGQVRELGAS